MHLNPPGSLPHLLRKVCRVRFCPIAPSLAERTFATPGLSCELCRDIGTSDTVETSAMGEGVILLPQATFIYTRTQRLPKQKRVLQENDGVVDAAMRLEFSGALSS